MNHRRYAKAIGASTLDHDMVGNAFPLDRHATQRSIARPNRLALA